MDKPKARGLFIVFEGIDRAGKSTQIELLKDYLKNVMKVETKVIRFPDRDIPSGKMLDEYLKNSKKLHIRASHLLFSFNRWEKREYILNEIDNGTTIISDRYAFSGIAYSLANNCEREFAYTPDKGLPRPDIVFQLDMDPEFAKKRDGFGEEIYEKDEVQVKVREKYKEFHDKQYWKIIDASKTRDEVSKSIISIIDNKFDELIKNDSEDESKRNYYPKAIGEDLFFLPSI